MTDFEPNASTATQADAPWAERSLETSRRLTGRIVREDEWLNPGLARQRASSLTATGRDGGPS